MKTYNQYAAFSIQEKYDYYEALKILENPNLLSDGFLDKLTSGIKSKIDFIKAVAEYGNNKLEDVVKLFKDSRVFKFFSQIKFSLDVLWKHIKTGFKTYVDIQKIIAQYIAKTKIGKWTEDALRDLDRFLQSHPAIKRIAGVAVAGMLLYIWLNMSFTGDFNYDFNFADLLSALAGKFSLPQLFAGEDGIRMLLLFATGIIGLSFPWPGATSTKFVVALLNGLRRVVGMR